MRAHIPTSHASLISQQAYVAEPASITRAPPGLTGLISSVANIWYYTDALSMAFLLVVGRRVGNGRRGACERTDTLTAGGGGRPDASRVNEQDLGRRRRADLARRFNARAV